MIYGYARVSTTEQDLTRQVEELQRYGCDKIYSDKISGSVVSRPELNNLLKELKPGDMVVVHKLDRLGRSLTHLIEIVNGFRSKNITFKSLTDPIDTSTATGNMIFQVIAIFAEYERTIITERIRHGMASRKANGVKMGRPKKDFKLILDQISKLKSDGMKSSEIIATIGLKKGMYYWILNSQTENIPNLG